MAIRYMAYLSGLDMLAAIAIILPFAFLLAYAALSVDGTMNASIRGAAETTLFNTKMQELLELEWSNATELDSMLTDSLGPGYTLIKAPPYPNGTVPPNVLRLETIGGYVYYIEGENNESADIN